MGVSLVEILIASDIVIDFREGDLNVYHHFAQEILWEGPENMHREWCCTISCKGRSSWLLDFEKRCTSGNAYSHASWASFVFKNCLFVVRQWDSRWKGGSASWRTVPEWDQNEKMRQCQWIQWMDNGGSYNLVARSNTRCSVLACAFVTWRNVDSKWSLSARKPAKPLQMWPQQVLKLHKQHNFVKLSRTCMSIIACIFIYI